MSIVNHTFQDSAGYPAIHLSSRLHILDNKPMYSRSKTKLPRQSFWPSRQFAYASVKALFYEHRRAELGTEKEWRAFKLMSYARHRQTPTRKHENEDTPRDCSRSASHISGFLVEILAISHKAKYARLRTLLDLRASGTRDPTIERVRFLSGFPDSFLNRH